MPREMHRVGDQYRIWTTVSDGYYDAPMSADDMLKCLTEQWGISAQRALDFMDRAEVMEQFCLCLDAYGDPIPEDA